MAFAYSDLQSEVLRRALRNQGGSQFTIAIQNAINLSMWRIARDAKWRTLRRKAVFNTITTYSVGTGFANCTKGSNVFSVIGATFISDGIRLGRYIKFDGSVIYFKIASITSETSGTLDQVFDGTSGTTLGYGISPQEDYTLPIQIGHSAFLWHRKYGMPKQLEYIPAQDFYKAGVLDILTNIPVAYRMWGMDAAIQQPISASVMSISSSVSTDTSIAVTIFGTVNGYPDYEIINTNASNATTVVSGTKSFSFVERIVKNQSTTGTITINSNLQTNTYSFTVSGITTAPVIGNTYTNNAVTFTVKYLNLTGASGSLKGIIVATGSGAPTSSGTLTRATGTADATITFSLGIQQSVNIGVLPVGVTTTGPYYTKVQLYPLPNSIFPINVYYYKLPYQLINAGDVPEIGEEFSEAIILLASAKLKAEQNQAADSQNFMNLYMDEIKSLKATNLDKIDWKMVLKRAGENDNIDQFTGGLRFQQVGGSGQYGGSWNP